MCIFGHFCRFWLFLTTFSFLERKVHTVHTSPSDMSKLKQFPITCVTDIANRNGKHCQIAYLKLSVFSIFLRFHEITGEPLIMGFWKHRESILWVILRRYKSFHLHPVHINFFRLNFVASNFALRLLVSKMAKFFKNSLQIIGIW